MSVYTNGASLEDCHTNVYVLTELTGLKWKRFVTANEEQTRGCWDVAEEPILQAYGRCLTEHILCVWRRTPIVNPPASGPPKKVDIRLAAKKELWVFWYGDEPENLKKITSSLSNPSEDEKWCGSWERGIDYDIRTLLFKALHILIERCLLSKNIVRLGKWFVQPLEPDACGSTNYVVAFNFSFFVHGENNVCYTVNSQRQPPVYRIARKHLAEKRKPVLLAPWALSGTLSPSGNGVDLPEGQKTQSGKQWREWLEFFPFPRPDNMENLGYVDPVEKERQERASALALPQMVEVSVAGVRMFHPSSMVLTLNPEDTSENKGKPSASPGKKTGGSPMKAATPQKRSLPTSASSSELSSLDHEKPVVDALVNGGDFSERVVADLFPSRRSSSLGGSLECVTPGGNPLLPSAPNGGPPELRPSSSNPSLEQEGQQRVKNDVIRKDFCGCPGVTPATPGPPSASPGLSQPSPVPGGLLSKGALKAQGSFRGWDKGCSKMGRSGFFHRRSPLTVMEDGRQMTPGQTPIGNGPGGMPASTNGPGPASVTTLPRNSSIISTPISSPGFNRPPTISTSNLPPHEPITQMISPVPPPTTSSAGGENSEQQQQQSFQFQQTYTSALSSNLANQSNDSKEGIRNSDVLLHLTDRPNTDFDSTRSLKRPRIDDTEGMSPGHFRAEEIDANRVLCQEPTRKFWEVPGSLHPAQSDSQLSTVKNSFNYLSKVISGDGTGHSGTTPSQTANDTGSVDGEGRNISNRELQPSASLPDNFMDTNPELLNSALDHGAHDTVGGIHIISPPASNEREDDSMLKTGNGGKVAPQFQAGGGPPSVGPGPYSRIFPTPPSMEPAATSPESLALTGNSVPLLNPGCKDRALTVMNSRKIVGQENPHSTISRNFSDVSLTSNTFKSVVSDWSIFDLPRKIDFLHSSKFYGPTKLPTYLKSITADSKVAAIASLEYKPSPQTLPVSSSGDSNPPVLVKHQYGGHNIGNYPGNHNPSSLAMPKTKSSSSLPDPMSDFDYGRQPTTPQFPSRQASFGKPSPYGPQPTPSPVGIMTPTPMNIPPRTPRTPGGTPQGPQSLSRGENIVDINSPLSNASCSTPYARNLNSIDNSMSQLGSLEQSPEAHSLVATLLLSDTFIDLHRDASFDSCPCCACGNPNIGGVELGTYVAATQHNSPNNGQSGLNSEFSMTSNSCNCGFSAVRYRYLSVQSGMFAEDELEATSCWRLPKRMFPAGLDTDHQKLSDVMRQLTLVQDLAPEVWKYTSPMREFTRLLLSPKNYVANPLDQLSGNKPGKNVHYVDYSVSPVEYMDFTVQCNSAMEAACMVMDCTIPSISDPTLNKKLLSTWGFQKTVNELDSEDFESLSVLSSIVESIESALKDTLGREIEGPLTWRTLERKCATRGSTSSVQEDDCTPEPVPQVLLTTDKDFIQVSPLALRWWDRLSLEPYCQQKDVIYIGVIPENPHVMQSAQNFFSELSKVYEFYKFGRHLPYSICATLDQDKHSKGVKQIPGIGWFDGRDTSPEMIHRRMQAYEEGVRAELRQIFHDYNLFDRTLFRRIQNRDCNTPMGAENVPPAPAPSPIDPAIDGSIGSGEDDSEYRSLPHIVVIYLVNPIPYRPERSYLVNQSILYLLRLFMNIVAELPEENRNLAQVEIVPLEKVMDYTSVMIIDKAHNIDNGCPTPKIADGDGERGPSKVKSNDMMRVIAFNVFSQIRCLTSASLLTTHPKCLTGFGPASANIKVIKQNRNTRVQDQRMYRFFCPPFILPVTSGSQRSGREVAPITSSLRASSDEGSVLLVEYCLSENQTWLFAAATDHQGSILENVHINLATDQDRQLAKHGEVIRKALISLWEFIMGVLASGTKPWRLVISRLGRIGQIELKIWSQLLHKTNLKKTSNLLREQCRQCTQISGFHETPAILSACLKSREPEGNLRVFTRSFAHDERFGQSAKQRPLSTPEDVSCTHILVFPTSAGLSFATSAAKGDDNEDFDLSSFEVPFDDGLGLDELLSGVGDTGNVPQSAGGPRSSAFLSVDANANVELSLQPLAMGLYISTAPGPGLPNWFWSSCPAAKRRTPVHLKSALHLHTPRAQENDENFDSGKGKKESEISHPLDSRFTPDVLRYPTLSY